MLKISHGCFESDIDFNDIKNINYKYRILNIINRELIYDVEKHNLIEIDGFIQKSINKFDKNGKEIYIGDILLMDNGFKAIVSIDNFNNIVCDGERNQDYFKNDNCKWEKYTVVGYLYDNKTSFKFYED
jgi:hypothetical protein